MMSGGRLRAMGTSLFLKNHFGSGYQIHLLTAPSNIPQLEGVVKELLPSSEIVGNAGGNLTVALPRKSVRLIPEFFRWIDQAKRQAHDGILVKEWSISNSTLEEVFLRLCSAEKGINEVAVDFGKQNQLDEIDKKRICVICNQREAQVVTVYTKTGIAVQCPNLICMSCCMGPEYDSEEKKLKEIEDGGMFGETGGNAPGNGGNGNGGVGNGRSITFVPAIEDQSVSSASGSGSASSAVKSTPVLALPAPSSGISPSSLASIPVANISSPSPSSSSPSSAAPSLGGGSNEGSPFAKGLAGAVGVRPPTMYQQIRAVFLKNFALTLTEKKTWIAKCLLMIIFAFIMGTGSNRPDGEICAGGWSP
jgi:hypothetical protein